MHYVSSDWMLLTNVKLSPRVRSTHTRRSYPHPVSSNSSSSSSNSNNDSSSNNNNNNNNNSSNNLQVSLGFSPFGLWSWFGGFFSFPSNRRREFAYVAFTSPHASTHISTITGLNNNVGGNNDSNNEGGIRVDGKLGTMDGTTGRGNERVEDDSSEGIYLDDGLPDEQDGMLHPLYSNLYAVSFTF